MKARRFDVQFYPHVRFHAFLRDPKWRYLVNSVIIGNIAYDMKNSISIKNVNMNLPPLTSAQIRAARALIRWSAEDLQRVRH